MSLGWFDRTEPLSTSLQGKQGIGVIMHALYSSGLFKHIEPYPTFSEHMHTETAMSIFLSHEFSVVHPYL